MIIAVTGHRPPKLGSYRTPNPIYRAVKNAITEFLQQKQAEVMEMPDPLIVLSGMALGVDQWTAEICNEWGIPWDAIIPFRGFENRWPDEAQRKYHDLIHSARREVVIADTYEYKASHLYRRNAWMVDNSDFVLAVWNGSAGGTANCVEYARRRGKRVENLQLPIEIWDQAREIEQRQAGRRAQFDANQQYLMNSLGSPPPALDATSREYAAMQARALQQYPRMTSSGMLEHVQQVVREMETSAPLQEAGRQALMNRFYEREPPTLVNSAAQAEAQQRNAEAQIGTLRRQLEESMIGMIGRPADEATRDEISRNLSTALEDMRRTGVVRGDIHVTMSSPAQFIGLDFAVTGGDRTVAQVAQVVQEEPKKEIIAPEKRFLPGRIIDIED